MKLNFNACTNFAKVACKRIKYTSIKHSPEVLLVAGTIGIIGATVMACKATLKVDEVLDEAKKTVDTIHEVASDETKKEQYTEEDSTKDLAITYVKTGAQIAKLYGPAIVIGALSIGCFYTSHHILCKRNIALATAYAGLKEEYKRYRSHVVNEMGEKKDHDFKYGIKANEIVEKVIDEDGKEVEIKKTINEYDPSSISEYARFFREYSYYDENGYPIKNPVWTNDPEDCLYQLKLIENEATIRLQSEKYLYLNDVYDRLGIPRTRAGQKVGWIYDEKHPIGDNKVDFGLYRDSESFSDFISGKEDAILLDFNVDGEILDLMPTYGFLGFGSGNKHRDEFDLKAHA